MLVVDVGRETKAGPAKACCQGTGKAESADSINPEAGPMLVLGRRPFVAAWLA